MRRRTASILSLCFVFLRFAQVVPCLFWATSPKRELFHQLSFAYLPLSIFRVLAPAVCLKVSYQITLSIVFLSGKRTYPESWCFQRVPTCSLSVKRGGGEVWGVADRRACAPALWSIRLHAGEGLLALCGEVGGSGCKAETAICERGFKEELPGKVPSTFFP